MTPTTEQIEVWSRLAEGEQRYGGRLTTTFNASVVLDLIELCKSLAEENTRLRAERDTEAREHSERIKDNQKRAAAMFGFEPGGLQMAWRDGKRTDRRELEYAIVDALAMGCVLSWSGDGTSCAAQIVTKQMDRADKAEEELGNLRKRMATYLAESYRQFPQTTAQICVLQLDPSGALLGYVREAAARSLMTGGKG